MLYSKFSEQNTLYFRLRKNDKISQKDKTKFHSTVHGLQNLNLSFLLSPNYNIFRSENLHTYRIQHCLRHNIFFKIFGDIQIQNFKALNSGHHGARAPNGCSHT
jgi:hypothetical protein